MRVATSGTDDLGRFAEPSLYILVSLADRPKHGYLIMQDVEVMSGRPLGPGTLYGALARLERRGLIEALDAEDRRRPYRLTATGGEVLRSQLDDIEQFVALSRQRIPRTRS